MEPPFILEDARRRPATLHNLEAARAMTDSERVRILVEAIRCILEYDRNNRNLRMKLIKSILAEAVKQCGETVEEAF